MSRNQETFLLRSLGYLCLPEGFKKRFGITTKKKFRLKIFPEPQCDMVEDSDTITIKYIFSKKELEDYERVLKTGEETNE